MNKELLLKSLHICLRLPVTIYDSNFNICEEYRSDQTISFLYNYKPIIKELCEDKYQSHILSGHFDEMFIYYQFNGKHFLFGPFRCNIIDKTFFYRKMNDQKVNISDQTLLYEHMKKLPLYSLGDVRDILILVHYFFTGTIEDLLSGSLSRSVKNFKEESLTEYINSITSSNFDPEAYLFHYENKILNYVKQGNVEELKHMVFKLSNGVIPSISGDILRTEKNYSIIVFEKLSQTAITLGADLIWSYETRDQFIKKNELSQTLSEVLEIRDTAIVFYTNEISKTRVKMLSPIISTIVQFISHNVYKRLTIKEISEYFNLSESKLRLLFKSEMGETIQNYIIKRKVFEAKIMLKSNSTINEVALNLGFSDASHFSRTFKKYLGLTPKKYQQSLKVKIDNSYDTH